MAWFNFKAFIKGAGVALIGGTIGGFVAGFLAPIAPYAAIVGGGLALVLIDMFYK